MSKKVFVAGATGFQGGAIARKCIEEGYQVVTLSTQQKPPSSEGHSKGVEIIPGSFADQGAVLQALEGVQYVCLTFPLRFDRELLLQYGQHIVEAVKHHAIKQMVWNTSISIPNKQTGLIAFDSKNELTTLFEKAGLPIVTVVPDIYMDNLVAPWSIPLLKEQGILPYPVPSGVQIPWISHHDLAEFVFAAMHRQELQGQRIEIGGAVCSGEELAKAIGAQVGKPIQYIGVTPDDFEKQVTPMLGPEAAHEIANIYRYVEEHQALLGNKNFQLAKDKLGVDVQSASAWASSLSI